MTNTELIQAIKTEIERHLNSATEHQNANPDMPKYRWYLYEGEKELCTDLLGYIDDSLESEKPMNPDDAMKELEEKIALVKQRGTWDGVDVDKYMDEVRGREPEDEKKVPTRIYLGSKYEFIRRDIILKEIEGLKKNNEVSDDSEYAPYELDVACGYDMACDNILSFLKPFAEVDKHPKNILAPSKECEPGLREPLESEKPVPKDLDFEQELYNHFGQIRDFTLGMRIGQYFYNLGRDSVPLPEDTVLFNKGVEEGKRLMMEEAAMAEMYDNKMG